MIIRERKLPGVFEIQPEPREDHRGFFMRAYDEGIFREYGIHRRWVQENHSRSERKGTIRGMHFQFPPAAETKLVRVVAGAIWDVFIDLRRGSPTFGQWDALELSAQNKTMVYIPRGFAHGNCSLTDGAELLYKVDHVYAPRYEGIIRWNDPELNMDWPDGEKIVSEKDAAAASLKEFTKQYDGLEFPPERENDLEPSAVA